MKQQTNRIFIEQRNPHNANTYTVTFTNTYTDCAANRLTVFYVSVPQQY